MVEERMDGERARLKLGVSLGGDEEGLVRSFDELNKGFIRGGAGNFKTAFFNVF